MLPSSGRTCSRAYARTVSCSSFALLSWSSVASRTSSAPFEPSARQVHPFHLVLGARLVHVGLQPVHGLRDVALCIAVVVVCGIAAHIELLPAILRCQGIHKALHVPRIDLVIIQQGIRRLIIHVAFNRFCSVF